jgi:hypothetical protein
MSPSGFDASADQLATALTTDIGWVRHHTDYGEAARRWAAAGRANGLLLRSPALEEAEHWIASRPQGAPQPAAETQVFLAESRRGATRRRNVLTGSLQNDLKSEFNLLLPTRANQAREAEICGEMALIERRIAELWPQIYPCR